jgi:acetyltransferase-like isoleucine patch superfamily enzyme
MFYHLPEKVSLKIWKLEYMNKKKFSVITDVTIGSDTRIHDHVNLYKCKIGKDTKIDAFVYIEQGVVIGDRVKIRPFTFIPTGVTVENDVFIGPHVTFTNDKYPKINSEWKLLKTTIKQGSSIGAGCVILPVTVGSNSHIGAGSVVTKDIPDNVIAFGNPAKVIRKIPLNEHTEED